MFIREFKLDGMKIAGTPGKRATAAHCEGDIGLPVNLHSPFLFIVADNPKYSLLQTKFAGRWLILLN